MRVILLQDIKNFGKKYEIKEAKSGYARNFLIPQGLAKPATKEALLWLETQREVEVKRAEEELEKFESLASALDDQEIVIPVKIGENGQLFEGISSQKIAEKLNELGFQIKKNQIDLPHSIKEVGEFPVKVKFEHNLEAEIKLIITEEK